MLATECTLCRRRGSVDAIEVTGPGLVCDYCGGPAQLMRREETGEPVRSDTRREGRTARYGRSGNGARRY